MRLKEEQTFCRTGKEREEHEWIETERERGVTRVRERNRGKKRATTKEDEKHETNTEIKMY